MSRDVIWNCTGLTLEQTTSRAAELNDSANPLSLDTLVEAVTTNGRTHTATYDGAAREWSISSPEGRTATTVIDGQSPSPGSGLSS